MKEDISAAGWGEHGGAVVSRTTGNQQSLISLWNSAVILKHQIQESSILSHNDAHLNYCDKLEAWRGDDTPQLKLTGRTGRVSP